MNLSLRRYICTYKHTSFDIFANDNNVLLLEGETNWQTSFFPTFFITWDTWVVEITEFTGSTSTNFDLKG